MKRTLKLILFYFLYQLVCTAIVMVVALVIQALRTVTPDGNPGEFVSMLGQNSLATNPVVISLGVLLAAIAMCWHLVHFNYIKPTTAFLKEKKNITVLLVCIPLTYTFLAVMSSLCELVNLPNIMEDSFMDMSHNVFGILAMTLAAPIVEESLFRGAIEGHLLKIWKRPWVAVVVSGLLFGIIHMNPAQSLYAALIGIFFGWLYWKTGSILPGLVGHVINNTVACVSMNLWGADACLEDMAGEAARPYLMAGYAVIMVLCFVFLYRKFKCQEKKTEDECNLSETENV